MVSVVGWWSRWLAGGLGGWLVVSVVGWWSRWQSSLEDCSLVTYCLPPSHTHTLTHNPTALRTETLFILRKGAIQAFLVAYHFNNTQLLLFVTLLPVLLSLGGLPPSSLFLLLSLTDGIRRSFFSYLPRVIFPLSETHIATFRLQVVWDTRSLQVVE